MVQQYSPDGDTTQFFYDRLGRLTVSQNKEQQTTASYSGSANRFSYTGYDALGRITEVGEKSGTSDIRSINMLDTTAVKTWLASGTNKQITKTIYDSPVNPLQLVSATRKRVTASIYLENAGDTEGDSTLYVYDVSGNVKTLIQHVKALVAVDATNGKKRIDYDYDLVSGKVNMVSYQDGKGDQFYYKYLYDADNRVIQSLSSRDKLVWTDDASYLYYLHGPLARTEFGHWKVQGLDYAYTLQGWLKGINGDALNQATEMAGDGFYGSMYNRVSRDVYAFKLGYHSNDYKPIGGTAAGAFSQYTYTAPGSLDNTGNQLYNGNISYSTLALSKFDTSSVRGYSYGYDQLNRLVEMRQHSVTGAWSNSNIISAYAESISYDANGNILKYLRRGANTAGSNLNMDSLTYKYNWGTDGKLINNQLNYVKDTVSASNYTVDIHNQSANNYTYDHIGNLKKDVAEGIDTIRWTVYGKINRIVKNSNSLRINYGYDPGGNRTSKVVSGASDTTTFYVRDAQGNVLAIYTKKGANALQWNEQDLYGSSRIGLWRWDTIVPAAPPVAQTGSPIQDSLMIGARNYELTNHLGNVLSTISDKKIGHDSSGVVNYYIAEVLSQNDYYPFGMMMPGRKYSATSPYRYGFNGKENDNDVKGEGNQQDYGMRIYDPRIGKFLSVDPVTSDFPWSSPYAFAENDVIRNIDLDGLEKASPASYDIAVKLRDIMQDRITQAKGQLAKVTDKDAIERLKLSIELDKKTYAKLVIFLYKNHPTDEERILYYTDKAKPIVKEALDVTPAGDVKVVITGKNFQGEDRSRLGAVGWLALDIFGGEILSGLGKATRSIRLVEGAGKEVLEGIIKKVDRISTALDEAHIRAAVNDVFGSPVTINGKVYDHLTEVRNALGGLKNQIKELNKLIASKSVSTEIRETATELRNTLTKQKDQINSVLDRATKAAKK